MQLKQWKIRKNATQDEWRRYFTTKEDRSIPTSVDVPGEEFSPVILNKSTKSRKRASRWASGRSVAPDTILAPRVSDSTSPDNENHPNEPTMARRNTPPGFENSFQDMVHSMHVTESFSFLSEPCSINFTTQSLLGSPSMAVSEALNIPEHSLGFSLAYPVTSGLQSPICGLGNFDLAEFSLGDLPARDNTSAIMLQDIRQKLPFAQLEQSIRSRGIILERSVGHTIFGGFASRVVADIFASEDHQVMTRQPPNLQRFLHMLGAQLPGESSALITEDQAFETKFARVLLFSMLNGFSGLDDIPMEKILRFLNRVLVNKLLLDVLEQSPRCVSRTLADNIFRAAVEATDTKVVNLLLNRRLVDVNETVCLHRTTRYTPIERAAVLRSLKLMRSLIAAGADVNKSHADCNRGGALNALIKDLAQQRRFSNADDRPAIPAESMEALNMLVSAGARVRPGMMLLDSDPQAVEFNFLIFQNARPQNHREFFDPASDSCLLIGVVRYFDDHHATRWIRNLINLCHQAGCNKCLVDFGDALKETIIQAASSGKLGFVQSILHEAAVKPNLAPVFLAAIGSQNPALIDFILSLGPDLDPPAIKVDLDPARPRSDFLRTPIAEAVRYGNQHLIRILEAGGCLDHLTEGNRFEAVIGAAAETGNTAYMRKLLARAMTSQQAYRPTRQALALALSRSHQDTAQMLLEAGAISSDRSDCHDQFSLEIPISLDMPMVHALIAAGAGVGVCKQLAGIDRSIAAVVVNEYPGHRIFDDDLLGFLHKCIRTDALDFFKDFVQKQNPEVGELDRCLAVAVKLGHSVLVGYLLDMGANPFLGSVLRNAIPDQPDMLHLLLQKERRRQTIPKCIGACVLEPVMGNSAGNAEALDELIRTDAINFERLENVWDFVRDYSQPHSRLTTISPLGMAIQGLPRKFETNMVAMKQFLEAGADPNGISKLNDPWHKGSPLMTALMLAIETGREDAVNMLLDYGADVNAQPRIRTTRTALQFAAELGNIEMVRLLLSRDADVSSSAPPRGGATALQFAAMSGNCNMVAELLDHGAQLDALPSKIDGMWPLEGAAAHGRLDMIRFLWELKVRADAEWKFPKGFSERQCLRAMNFARENAHIGCRDLISDLSGISVDRLETDEYGAPWIAY